MHASSAPALDFIQGFADSAGISTRAAQGYWTTWAQKKYPPHEREEIESRGYIAGQAQAARWIQETD